MHEAGHGVHDEGAAVKVGYPFTMMTWENPEEVLWSREDKVGVEL